MLAHDMARASDGAFLLRMEDTDRDRCRPEHEVAIAVDLRWLGLRWDGPVLRQSDRNTFYNARLEPLAKLGLLYPCSCTRADIRAALSAPQEGIEHAVYPGTCRGRGMDTRRPGDAVRLDLTAAFDCLADRTIGFIETGPIHAGLRVVDPRSVHQTIGDVVLSRKGEDGIAYFLASAIDDADQGITHVIRGEDLFAFTPVQVLLQGLLDLPTPIYHHHRLIRDEAGRRLAKRDDARAIARYRAKGATPADIRRLVGL